MKKQVADKASFLPSSRIALMKLFSAAVCGLAFFSV
jgi:hypothetical protein